MQAGKGTSEGGQGEQGLLKQGKAKTKPAFYIAGACVLHCTRRAKARARGAKDENSRTGASDQEKRSKTNQKAKAGGG